MQRKTAVALVPARSTLRFPMQPGSMASRVPIQQDRSLLNPKFDGYKLSFLEESRLHFLSIGAPGPGITVSKLSSTTKLSYRQIQSRIRHNHLHPGWNSFKPVSGDGSAVRDGVLFAVDENFMLIALQFDKVRQGKAIFRWCFLMIVASI